MVLTLNEWERSQIGLYLGASIVETRTTSMTLVIAGQNEETRALLFELKRSETNEAELFTQLLSCF